MDPQSQAETRESQLQAARLIIDDAWKELQRSPYVQQRMGVTPTQLPDVSVAEVERRSRVGHSLLERLESIDSSGLPHDLALSLRLVRFRAQIWSREADWYWTVVDPRGIGQFGLFLPTAYCGGYVLTFAQNQLASFTFREPGDTDRYLELIADYGRLIDQFQTRAAGQLERGIRMPRVQVIQARALLRGFRASARQKLAVTAERYAQGPAGFTSRVEDQIAGCVECAFDRLLEGLSDQYLAAAPQVVGIGQYPGGAAVYAELVKLHTTLELNAEEIHRQGITRIAQIEDSIGSIQAELGFAGDPAGFTAYLNDDPQWRATTPEGVAAVFQRYIDRLKPRFAEAFSAGPKAAYGVHPLPESLQGSMTYGYYDAPKSEGATGTYLFNAANLTRQPLFHLGAITYHELMPGHHLQFARQQENPELHPFRAYSFVTAYIEGWAEYAAALAGEMGLYEAPQERYGRLVMDAFLTTRLVVDTGMNVLGWSLERARQFMRKHSRLSEAEILTETVRYSCDIPGQALAYKLGDTKILELRERMRAALGMRFDLRHFHELVLSPGALPLTDLEWHIDHASRSSPQTP